ncbi:MAG TPA: hypothetical protein PK856_03420 [Vitreoscilla sp.]|nr:hypothetical protein [Vitreoscilla sp.]
MQHSLPIKILLVVAFLCYPFLMLFGLSHWGITPIALVLMVATLLKLLVSKNSQLKPLYVLGILCGLLSLLRQDEMWVKFYPACMNVGWLLVFAWSLHTDQSMIERIARTHEPDLPLLVWHGHAKSLMSGVAFSCSMPLFPLIPPCTPLWLHGLGITALCLMS